MTTYRTGNPIGSKDPRDLYDNAENLDTAVNDPSSDTWSDRLGRSRKTMSGMEREFNSDQDDRDFRFNTFIASSGYQFLGDYAAGIEITEYNQIVRDSDGEFWRLSGQMELPYTTTGAGLPEDDAMTPLGDAVLRQELANPDMGAALVGFKQDGTGAVARTLEDKARDFLHVKDFGAVGDGVTDDYAAITAFIAECRTRNAVGRFDALPYYIGNGTLDISGVTLEGVYRGHRNVAGTRIIGNGTATVLRQESVSSPNQFCDLKNIRVEGSVTGLVIRYGLYNRLMGIDIFEPSGDGFLLGEETLAAGPLGVFADRVNVWNSGGDALKMRGMDYNNSNIFFRSWFQTANPLKSCADISVTGGYGGLSNRFEKCQFSGVGAGMTAWRMRGLVLDQMYMETQGPAFRSLGAVQAEIRSPIFGSLRNDNGFGENSFIHHEGSATRLLISNPFITLGSGSDQSNLRLIKSANPSQLFASITGHTVTAIGASGWELFDASIQQSNIEMVSRETYVPQWSSSGATQPDIGNGTLTGIVNRNGNTVTVSIRLIAGSSTDFGAGAWSFSLPYASRSIATSQGQALSGQYRYLVIGSISGSTISPYKPETASPVGPNQPFAWSSGDQLLMTATYQL